MGNSSEYDDELQGGITKLKMHTSEFTGIRKPFTAVPVRFHGKSSETKLIQTMRKVKELYLRQMAHDGGRSLGKTSMRPQFWITPAVSRFSRSLISI
jgi:hypothetical protein